LVLLTPPKDFEQECLLPTNSVKISELGVALLKMVSSHRGLTYDLPNILLRVADGWSVEIFDEYTRRQYLAKAPERNPFGTDEEPLKFADFDVFTKIRILHQLSVWTFWNPDKIREKMPEFNPEDQSAWVSRLSKTISKLTCEAH
jgi:DNA-directed RNA polymerase